ncbi:MAG: tRNA lysidine(34) synthetase TilS [Promicromonosporaceae bacterium]|nr:tRNA lysidine(34) synthetase TilS [Promicromonosporaceae bacterium]
MARLDPAVAAVRAAVRATLASLALRPGDLVLVACSGGADSLALAAALAHEASRVGRSVRSRGFAVRASAVVVDHGLQAGSSDVADVAAARCRALGLDPVEVRRVAVTGAGGPEAAARDARYAALDAAAAASGAVAVLLGHTLDDQAEQVLLGLARGSGARSLAGMPAARGVYRRPLLGLRRSQTRAACHALGLRWWDDPTNDLSVPGPPPVPGGAAAATPLRTRVRHEVLPLLEEVLGPGTVEALARSAAHLRDDADALDAQAAALLAAARTDAGAGLALDVGLLEAAPAAVRRRALRAAAIAVGAPARALGTRHVDALDALVVGWRGQGSAGLPSGASAARACGTLFLHRGPDAAPSTPPHRTPEE